MNGESEVTDCGCENGCVQELTTHSTGLPLRNRKQLIVYEHHHDLQDPPNCGARNMTLDAFQGVCDSQAPSSFQATVALGLADSDSWTFHDELHHLR